MSGYERTEAKLRALVAQREAERWRDCPTPGCRLEEGHDGLHRFVPEVSRLREEVERLTRQVEWQEQRRTEERLKVEESVASWHRREADLVARAEEAERERDEVRAKLVTVTTCEGVMAHRALMDSLAAYESREREMREALRNLLVWAEWIKKHIHRAPNMNEPNTGAVYAARAALSGSSPSPSGDVHRDVAPIQWLGDATQDGGIWELMRRRDRFFILGAPTTLYFKSDNGMLIAIQPGWWIYDWHTDHPRVSSAAPDSSGDVHRDDGQGFRKEEDNG